MKLISLIMSHYFGVIVILISLFPSSNMNTPKESCAVCEYLIRKYSGEWWRDRNEPNKWCKTKKNKLFEVSLEHFVNAKDTICLIMEYKGNESTEVYLCLEDNKITTKRKNNYLLLKRNITRSISPILYIKTTRNTSSWDPEWYIGCNIKDCSEEAKMKLNISCFWQDPNISIVIPHTFTKVNIEVLVNSTLTVKQSYVVPSHHIIFDPLKRRSNLLLKLTINDIIEAECEVGPLYVKPDIEGEIGQFCVGEECSLMIPYIKNLHRNNSAVVSYGQNVLVNSTLPRHDGHYNIKFQNKLKLNESKILKLNLTLTNLYLSHKEISTKIIDFNYTNIDDIDEIAEADEVDQPITYISIAVTLVLLLIAISVLIFYGIHRKRKNNSQFGNETASANIYDEIQYVEKPHSPFECIDNELYQL